MNRKRKGLGYPKFSGTGAIRVPAGNTATRPTSPVLGQTRHNTDTNILGTHGVGSAVSNILSSHFKIVTVNKTHSVSYDWEDFEIVRDKLLDAGSFDLYIKTSADTFKLETAVITNGSFGIERSRPLSIQIQGEASKLTRGAALAGTLQNRSAAMSYTVPKVSITLNSTLLDGVTSVAMELQNDISWTPYTTIHNALTVTNASNTMYPTAFVLSKKILSGSITQYLTDATVSNTLDWDTDASLTISAGNGLASPNFRGFLFGPATCSFTNRVNAGTVYTQNYDWRMVENVSSLATKLNYITD